MCGIAGWFSKDVVSPDDIPILHRMMQSIRHRGPDGKGSAQFTHACLGHVRLSIIDLASGQQPMHSHDKRFTISYNGEIYNYKELRKELLNYGHRFNTHSDTEVIMEIYRKYGYDGFSKLQGMYAFALWDNADNSGLLARDPLGIKPLFIHFKDSASLIFASEAKAILHKLQHTPELDPAQLHLLLNFRYVPGNASLFKDVEQLAPGSVLHWSPHASIKRHAIQIYKSPDNNTLQQLRESVHKHLTADVEVACYLSGGIDSSTIAVLSETEIGSNLRTFTLDIGDDPKEAQYAAHTAAHFGFQNIQMKVEPDATKDLQRMIWHLETPKINALQNWQLAKLTSQYVKVALSGLGGDELFLGYNMHKIMSQAGTLHRFIPSLASSALGSGLLKLYRPFGNLQWSETQRSLQILAQLGNWPRVYGLIRNIWDNPQLRTLIYGERMLAASLPDAYDYLGQQWPQNPDPVMAAAQFEWQQKMVNDLLWQEDRVSMAHGLEVRTPLVDGVLYSHMRNISRDVLMDKGKPKAYLKKVTAPILPETILNRPKSGFQVASYDFFHSHLGDIAADQLSEKKIKNSGLFNYDFVTHVLKFRPGKRLRWHYFILYFMILTHLWLDLFESDSWSRQP